MSSFPVPEVRELLDRLAAYPLSSRCFSNYVKWVISHAPNAWTQYDVLSVLNEGYQSRLGRIEDALGQARNILGVSEEQFSSIFGFDDDLLVEDPEKLHDVLAEPLFVVDLGHCGFSSIIKLPRSISSGGLKLRNADFLASRRKKKYAIELKTIRMENKPAPQPGRLLGDSGKPNWWGEMFRKNAITKIEDKNRRVLDQLANARRHYRCDRVMLGLYTRRLGPSALMTREDYVSELEALRLRYPVIDYFACKDYFGEVTIVPAVC